MKRIASLFLIPLTCLALSCNKEGEEGGDGTGTAILGVSVKGLPEVVEVPEHQTQTYELTVTANPGPSAVLNVNVGTDETLVAKYNLANGTSYEMLPAEAYEISSAPLMLMRFNKTSAPGTLKLKGAGCDLTKTYLLPLVVGQVKGTAAYEVPAENVVYVVFKMLEAQMEGAGTEASPYLIPDLESFKKMGNMLKDGETVHIRLTADIDFAGETWAPEIAEGEYTQFNAFGRPIALDGANHKIKNVVAACGLFSIFEGSAKNLTIENVKIEAGASKAGVLADEAGNEDSGAKVVVTDVTITDAEISNSGYVGGLFGSLLNGDIKNVNVACEVSGADRVAGLVGHAMSSEFTGCVTSGTVIADNYYIGGLVGLMYDCNVKNSSSSCDVTCNSLSNSYSRVGGLVGQMLVGGTIENCHATGNVVGYGYFGGGLIGVAQANEKINDVYTYNTINVIASYATGNVALIREGNAKDAGAGGLIGRLDGGNYIVTNCYATGAIEADRYSAGFIGDTGLNAGETTLTLTITNGFTNGDLSKLGPDANGNHSDGVAVGCLRNPTETTIICTGFVGWDALSRKFIYDDLVTSDGNYHGTAGTISQQAKAFNWDESVWDLTGDVPALK